MKIATFNINNVNKRLPHLLDWLEAARPDVACLQELKAEDHAFPADALAKVGYSAVWKGQKSEFRHERYYSTADLPGTTVGALT